MSLTLNQTNLAVKGGPKAVTLQEPAWPIAGNFEEEEMLKVVKSGNWSWLGENEMAFCSDYSDFIGTPYCITLANGTVTLQCALQALGVKPGDEVIVPGLTWVATAQAAIDIGANVVLVDIDAETLCIDPESFRAAITKKTKAVIPVHLYGCMCDMDAILEIAREYDIKVLEDVAHQHGSAWRGTRAGALGDAGSFSFQQTKVLTSGEGGAVTCKDKDVYECVFALKQVGWGPDPGKALEKGKAPSLVQANRYGHNYRMTEMQAVLLRGGLTRLEEQTKLREERAKYITEKLEAIGGPLRVARRDPRVTQQAYYALTLCFDPEKSEGVKKDTYAKALQAEGVGVTNVYDPVYRHKILNFYDQTSPIPFRNPEDVQDYANLHLPNVEKAVTETALTLPHQHLLGTIEYIDQILDAIEKVNNQLEEIEE